MLNIANPIIQPGLLRRCYRPALLFIVLIASLLRLAGIFDDFWLDEIWSWQFAMSAHSAREILFGESFHHDNNHVLNTLYLYALGNRRDWHAYRLLSLVTGIGLVMVAGILARRWGRAAAFAAVILTGFSYIFVHFSSEARGYAPASFFALASFAILRRFIAETAANQTPPEAGPSSSPPPLARRLSLGLGFAIVCILGILSHASFIYAFVGAVVWMPIALVRCGGSPPLKVARDLLTLFFVPWLFLSWFYRTVLRGMTIGGGPSTTLPNLLAQVSAFTLGLPSGPLAGWIGPALILALAGAGAWILRREGSDEWIFLVIAGLAAPAAILGIHHEQMYPRYLFVALPFLAMLSALVLDRLSKRGRVGPYVATLLLLLFVFGNMLHIERFLVSGRGHYFAAVEYIAEHTAGKNVLVGGYSEFRTKMLLDFYATRIPESGKHFIYVPDDSALAPEWYLFTPRIGHPTVNKLAEPQWIATYQLKVLYPHYGLAGWDWALYRRAAETATP